MYVCTFFTTAVIIRPPKDINLGFSCITCSLQFLSPFLLLLENRNKLLQLTLKLTLKTPSQCTSLLLHKKTNRGKLSAFLKRFLIQVLNLRVKESKITTQNALNRDHFGIKGN